MASQNSNSYSQYDPLDGRLHPMWSFLLMSFCINGALLVMAYALSYELVLLGAVVAAVLLLGACLVYRTS